MFFGPVCEMFAPLGKHFMFVAEEKGKGGGGKVRTEGEGGRTYDLIRAGQSVSGGDINWCHDHTR